MEVKDLGSVRYLVVDDVQALDPITLILKDDGGKGKIIAECYGESWSTYFGGIGTKSLIGFLSGINAGYLEDRFISNTFHKPTKREKVYVNRICQAIIDGCKLLKGDM